MLGVLLSGRDAGSLFVDVTRGTWLGRCGLNGGAFCFEAGYVTVSFGSLRGGIDRESEKGRKVVEVMGWKGATCSTKDQPRCSDKIRSTHWELEGGMHVTKSTLETSYRGMFQCDNIAMKSKLHSRAG